MEELFFLGASGLLSDDSDLTFSGDTLTATKIGAFTSVGAIDFNNQVLTNVDINSGTIDGTDITIGAGSTFNIAGGSLTTSPGQEPNIIEGAEFKYRYR